VANGNTDTIVVTVYADRISGARDQSRFGSLRTGLSPDQTAWGVHVTVPSGGGAAYIRLGFTGPDAYPTMADIWLVNTSGAVPARVLVRLGANTKLIPGSKDPAVVFRQLVTALGLRF
jgi:hypothetical protein